MSKTPSDNSPLGEGNNKALHLAVVKADIRLPDGLDSSDSLVFDSYLTATRKGAPANKRAHGSNFVAQILGFFQLLHMDSSRKTIERCSGTEKT